MRIPQILMLFGISVAVALIGRPASAAPFSPVAILLPEATTSQVEKTQYYYRRRYYYRPRYYVRRYYVPRRYYRPRYYRAPRYYVPRRYYY
jgi:hypothetical protein